ncbi:MAG: hypothetical protein P8M05_07565 [Flavobacteriales bacterium]|nr:hypothetical protein [Flavobacteriales bacterium]
MKNLFLPIIMVSGLLIGSCSSEDINNEPSAAPAVETPSPILETYNIDSSSTLHWMGYEAENKEGHNHAGSVAIKSGSVGTTDGNITSGKFVIGMNEISYDSGASNGGAVSPDNEIAGKVLGHFTDSSFLNNLAVQEATFTILNSDENSVNGELEFNGSVVAVSIPGKVSVEENNMTFDSTFNLDLSAASPYLAEAGWKIEMKLSLIASK